MKRIKIAGILTLVLSVTQSSFCQPSPIGNPAKIDSLMQSHIVHDGKKPVHNFLLFAKNESTGFEIHRGFGTVGRNKNMIDADYQYNCASITKMFLSTIILQLEEEGKLSIHDYAEKYLSDLKYVRFQRFHILHDTNYSSKITVRDLLQHTSGIADIFTDATTKFNISVWLHKKRQYNPEKIIQRYFKYHLNVNPFNKPGQGYHYSDINYMLLGFIIEKTTNSTLPEVIRTRILDKLAMNNTYFAFYEHPRAGTKQIDAYMNKINVTKRINTSYEWGGGGLVSTSKDLAIFIQALFDLHLFNDKTTLEKMIDVSGSKKFGVDAGLGIFRYEIAGKKFYGHGGFYGSLLVYDPIDRITFSANIGQAFPPYDSGALGSSLISLVMSK